MLGRAAGPERADVGTRISDSVSGDFRRAGMGAPGIGDTPPHLTASRPVPCSKGSCCAVLRAFWMFTAEEETSFGYPIPRNVIDGKALSSKSPVARCASHELPSVKWRRGCWSVVRDAEI